MATVLVTGSTGTLGSEVVRQLSTKGETVKAAARSANDTTFAHLNGVQTVQLDLNNTDTFSSAFQGIDKLFLLTPFQSNMVDLTSNLVNEAKNAKVKYIVKQSVMGADAEPGITLKRALELGLITENHTYSKASDREADV